MQGTASTGVDEPIPAESASAYRMVCARLNYYSLDRPDQYACKERTRAASALRPSDVNQLKRIGRHPLGQPHECLLTSKFQQEPSFLSGYTDADVSGCSATRRSTSGGASC